MKWRSGAARRSARASQMRTILRGRATKRRRGRSSTSAWGSAFLWGTASAVPNRGTAKAVPYVRERILQLVSIGDGTQRPVEPEGTAEAVGPRCRARHRQPLLVDLVRLVGVDEDIAVLVSRSRLLERHALMPAVHAADRIRLHGEREVLVDADVAPPDARAVGIAAREGPRAVHLGNLVAAALAIDGHQRGRAAIPP